MKENIGATLRGILRDTARETEQARKKRSLKRLRQMVKDTPDVMAFGSKLAAGKCLIAEIKQKSPSQGAMHSGNVRSEERL